MLHVDVGYGAHGKHSPQLCWCVGSFFSLALRDLDSLSCPTDTHPVCQVRMWWGLPGGVAASSLDGVELLWL